MSRAPLLDRLALFLGWKLPAPQSALDDEREHERRVRLISLCTWAVIVVGVPFIWIYASLGIPRMSVAVALTIVLSVTNLVGLRHHGSTRFSGHAAIALLYVLLVLSNIVSGGFWDPNFGWFYILPVASAMLIEVRAGWYWTAITTATVIAFWALDQLNVRWDSLVPPKLEPYQALANRLSLVAALGAIVILYATRQRRTEREIRDANAKLRREGENLRTLREVSDAANSTSNVEEAIGLCLDALTSVERWRIGHAYRVRAEDEALESTEIWRFDDDHYDAAARSSIRHAVLTRRSDVVREAIRTRLPQWSRDIAAELGEAGQALGLQARLVAPVTIGDEVPLVLDLFTEDARPLRPPSLDLMAHAGNQLGRVLERTRAEDRIRDLAYFDGLTGLPNRELFQSALQSAIDAARRYDRRVGLVFVDLDRFKTINDTLGHGVGDALLQQVADRFSGALRPSDTLTRTTPRQAPASIARLGGDEFTLVLSEVDDAVAVASVARRILRSLEDPFDIDGHEIFADASLGIALYPADGDNVETLLRKADTAMYAAKKRGGGTYEFYSSEMNDASWRRLRIETSLRTCLERRELELYYQPVVQSGTHRVEGVEALLRWHHPELGEIPPGEAIRTAEVTGLILPIGDWVLDTACAQLAAWRREGIDGIRLSVNLSARQLRRSSFVDDVTERLQRHELSPADLEFEITESLLMVEDAVTQVARLRDLGVRFAIDDFGTGFSSLARLRDLPIDRLKIDRSFISSMTSDHERAALAQAIIAMAHSLDLAVTAEGVETVRQARLLHDLGCQALQGFLYSPALPPNDLDPILTSTLEPGRIQRPDLIDPSTTIVV